jgi:UDPglucose 6-dehydrogenase
VTVKAYDPLANLSEVNDLPPIQMCTDPYQTAEGSSALVLVTEWAGINDMNFTQLRTHMYDNIFLDTRNLLDPGPMVAAGFRYLGIGR